MNWNFDDNPVSVQKKRTIGKAYWIVSIAIFCMIAASIRYYATHADIEVASAEQSELLDTSSPKFNALYMNVKAVATAIAGIERTE